MYLRDLDSGGNPLHNFCKEVMSEAPLNPPREVSVLPVTSALGPCSPAIRKFREKNDILKVSLVRFCSLFALIGVLALLAACAAAFPNTPTSATVAMAVSPASAQITAGSTQQFTVSVKGSANAAVKWTVNNVLGGNSEVGTISANGLFMAPVDPSTDMNLNIGAVSVANPTVFTAVMIRVLRRSSPSISVSHLSGAVQVGLTEQFSANVTGINDKKVNWLVDHVLGGSSSVGTISTTGLYRAPATVPATPSVTVTAVSQADPSLSASTIIVITPRSTGISLSVVPSSAAVPVDQTRQFTATVSGTSDTAVSWLVNNVRGGSSSVGTISSTGLYTAPVTANPSVEVTAISAADPTKSASASVTVTSASVSVSIAPASVLVQAGSARQFTATVSGASNAAVMWSVNNIQGGNSSIGTISSSGLFTAPASVSGTISESITATSYQDPTKSATATASISPATTTGANYYVAPNGSDSNDGSAAHPWATLGHANSRVSAGSTVQVSAGTYSQGSSQLNLTTSGSPSAYVTYLCSPIRSCYITSNITGNNTVIEIDASYVKVVGFDISDTNSSVPNVNMGVYITGSNDWMVQNTIHGIQSDCSSAGGGGINIATGGGSGDVFDANLIYDIGWANPACSASSGTNPVHVHGINLEANAPNYATVTNNIIYHVLGGWGIQSQHAASGTTGDTISNNLIFSNGTGGIVFVDAGGANDYNVVTNNIIVGNGSDHPKYGIYEYNTGTHDVYANNDLYGNEGGSYYFVYGSQTGGISVDPTAGTTFVNYQPDGTGDYDLRSGSPAIDAGTEKGSPNHDFDGGARPVNGVPDIGPYEFGSVPTPWPWP